MPINPDSVGETGGPVRASWTSKDALLYAVGAGAGTDELAFTTDNTMDTKQRVLPTFGVTLTLGRRGGVPLEKLGTFESARELHGGMGSDPARFRSMNARFSKPVIAGDALTVSIWVDGDNAIFRTTNQLGDIVLDQGTCTFT